jgi:predicted metal-dependent phosphoesterase TrpH
MIYEIFHIALWVTVILLLVSGLDDLFIDILYWFYRRKYKANLPTFSEMDSKPERSIAIMIGAWKEEKVIGRTLTIALKKLRYTNFRIFVAIYPNDLRTVKVVRDIARKDHRVILCLNPQDGPTTKADNLNNSYACIKEYERQFGEFDVILIHDSEDFIHPLSLKLFNYLIMYKGNYGVQIPVLPIKSRLGKMYHRTYCDAFAELHTKDMIVRQSMGSYMPFAGTGMAFNRKAFHYLESKSIEQEKRMDDYYKKHRPEEIHAVEDELLKDEQDIRGSQDEAKFKDDPYPQYENIKVPGWDDDNKKTEDKKYTSARQYSILLSLLVILVTIGVFYMINMNIFGDTMAEEITTTKVQNTVPVNNTVTTTTEVKTETVTPVNVDAKVIERITDKENNVFYQKLDNGKFRIQESLFSAKESADNRIEFLKSRNIIGKSEIALAFEDEISSKVYYTVCIGEYDSIESAKDRAKLLGN